MIHVEHFENGRKSFKTEQEFITFVQTLFVENGDEEHMDMPTDGEECAKYVIDFCDNFSMIYYQPELTDEFIERTNFFSFLVYLQKENAQEDYPNVKILEYKDNDIEMFTVQDYTETYNPDLEF